MISRLTMRPKLIRFRAVLKRRLSVLRMPGLSWTAIRSSRPWFLSVPSSLSYSQSSDSLETQDCVQPQLTSAEMSRPTLPLIRSSAKSSVLNLTRSSISLGELRSLGCFSPLKEKELISISRRTSGWRVLIRSTPVVRPRGY